VCLTAILSTLRSLKAIAVNRVMTDFRRDPSLLDKTPEPKGRPDYAINSSHESAIRNFIRKANKIISMLLHRLYLILFKKLILIAIFIEPRLQEHLIVGGLNLVMVHGTNLLLIQKTI